MGLCPLLSSCSTKFSTPAARTLHLSPFLVNKVLSDLAVALQRVQLQAFSSRTQSWLSLLTFFNLPSNLPFLGNLSTLLFGG